MIDFENTTTFVNKLFDSKVELLPGVYDAFEIELAYYEYLSLESSDLLERSAYIKSIHNKRTHHYNFILASSQLSEDSVDTLNFSSSYASHGLFPYKGKFHPQMVRALINIAGVQKGDVVLDPMAGSGTTNIEAALLGVKSIAIDISPFCQFMIKTKHEALRIDLDHLQFLQTKAVELFEFFSKDNAVSIIDKIEDCRVMKIYHIALLAYLDSMGYSKRVIRNDHKTLFLKVVNKYFNMLYNLHCNPYYDNRNIGNLTVLESNDALDTGLNDSSIDCIITSPPYSFALDYVNNDLDQLNYLSCDVNSIKGRMIGLKGLTIEEKLRNYFDDVDRLCKEASRVLKQSKFFIVVIGSNTNQTGGVRLENIFIQSSKKYNLVLKKIILKPIRGMRNTMKDEYILFFQKEGYNE